MKVNEISREDFLNIFETRLSDVLKDCDGVIGEAMRYATLDGGKRIRPLCVYYGARAMQGKCAVDDLMPVAIAIELIHSYSLVHDDMPEMDNDDERRGKPSVHAQFGAANALLAGDGLLSLAMKELLNVEKTLASEIADAAMNMVYGQSADLAGCKDKDACMKMYNQKTGSLISAAFKVGAMMATVGVEVEDMIKMLKDFLSSGKDRLGDSRKDEELQHVTLFAQNVAIGFQLADDLIDEDERSVVGLIGKEETQKLLDEYIANAKQSAEALACKDELIAFVDELCIRNV